MGCTRTKGDAWHGRSGEREKKNPKQTLKPRYDRWRVWSTREREEEQSKMKRMNGESEEKRKRAAEEERGG